MMLFSKAYHNIISLLFYVVLKNNFLHWERSLQVFVNKCEDVLCECYKTEEK